MLMNGAELGCPSHDLSNEFSSTVSVSSSAMGADKGQILDGWSPAHLQASLWHGAGLAIMSRQVSSSGQPGDFCALS